MNCVGIDVSKGKSMIAVMRPFGEVVVSPFEVLHTDSELSELARLLKSLDGETRVVMEATGNYHAPVAWLLHDAGLYVSVVNAMLVHDYGNNSLRRAKTDKKDAVKLANYGLDHWLTLPRYVPDEDIVFNTLGLPSSATAIFFSAAPTVAHISLPPFCQRQSRRHGAYGSLYLHTSPTGGNLPPLPASRLTEHGGLVIGRNDLQKIPFVAAAVQAGASFRVFDQLELGRLYLEGVHVLLRVDLPGVK